MSEWGGSKTMYELTYTRHSDEISTQFCWECYENNETNSGHLKMKLIQMKNSSNSLTNPNGPDTDEQCTLITFQTCNDSYTLQQTLEERI